MEIITKMIDMPCRIKACVTKNYDDTYTIFINARLPIDAQQKAYKHELKHIQNNDFENIENVEIKELRI